MLSILFQFLQVICSHTPFIDIGRVNQRSQMPSTFIIYTKRQTILVSQLIGKAAVCPGV